jgi:hypothetical protein
MTELFTTDAAYNENRKNIWLYQKFLHITNHSKECRTHYTLLQQHSHSRMSEDDCRRHVGVQHKDVRLTNTCFLYFPAGQSHVTGLPFTDSIWRPLLTAIFDSSAGNTWIRIPKARPRKVGEKLIARSMKLNQHDYMISPALFPSKSWMISMEVKRRTNYIWISKTLNKHKRMKTLKVN